MNNAEEMNYYTISKILNTKFQRFINHCILLRKNASQTFAITKIELIQFSNIAYLHMIIIPIIKYINQLKVKHVTF